MIPCVQVKTPYSSKALYRYTPKQVERIQGRTRQLTFTDIFKLAKREGIPFKERSLERYSVMFRDIYAPDKPEFDHAVGKYNYTYAFAFIEFMKKALGIKTKVDEFEQGKFILPRDLARAERLEKDAVLSVPIEEMSYGALHTLALYCKTHNGNTLAKRVADQLTDRFVDVALGKTRAKATDLREYAQRAIWDAFQTYDLYSGTPFMDHFKTYVTRTFAPDERRGYERHRKGDRLFSDPATKTDGDDRKFGDTLEDKGPDPETQLELAEQRHALYQSLGSLDETQRAVLLGFYFEDRSVLELAQQLGKDEAAVSSMLEDCIDHMRELMM